MGKPNRIRWAGVAVILGALLSGCAQFDVSHHPVAQNDTNRFYRTYVPERLRGAPGPHPVMLVLHGFGMFPDILDQTHMNRVAERLGFVAVYPHGVADIWNDGTLQVYGPNRSDDVAFVRRVVADVDLRVARIDRRRLFAVGFSNGGTMAMRLGCEAADLFAGVAAVTAAMPAELARGCRPARPIDVMIMNGTVDPIMPYKGGRVRLLHVLTFGHILSTDDTMALWARLNACAPPSPPVMLPDKDANDASRAIVTDWTRCNGVRMRLVRLEGGGHTWPNGLQYLPVPMIGQVNRDIDGGEALWEFFTAPRELAPTAAE